MRQVLQGQRALLAKRMIRTGHGHNRVVEERQKFQRHVLWHLRHDQQVVTIYAEAFDRRCMVDHGQLQTDFRVLLAEGRKQMRGKVFCAGLDGQAELALQRALQVGQLHVEAVEAGKDIVAGLEQCLGGVCQVELLADVIKQWLVEQFFQLPDLQADGRLGQ